MRRPRAGIYDNRLKMYWHKILTLAMRFLKGADKNLYFNSDTKVTEKITNGKFSKSAVQQLTNKFRNDIMKKIN